MSQDKKGTKIAEPIDIPAATIEDGTYQDTQDYDGMNYRILFRASSENDYYICTRAKEDQKAYYTLHVKPNDDAFYSSTGGVWTMIEGCEFYEKHNDPNTRQYDGYYVQQKTYLTAEQATAYFRLLNNLNVDVILEMDKFENSTAGYIKFLWERSEIDWSFISAFVKMIPIVSVGITSIETITDQHLEQVVNNRQVTVLVDDLITLKNKADLEARIAELYACGNFKKVNVTLYKPAKFNQLSLQEEERTEFVATTGVVITDYCNDRGEYGRSQIETYNQNTLVGGKYERGYWSH